MDSTEHRRVGSISCNIPAHIAFNAAETATILAALRNWQVDALNEDMLASFPDHFDDECQPLNNDEIDALCERINN